MFFKERQKDKSTVANTQTFRTCSGYIHSNLSHPCQLWSTTIIVNTCRDHPRMWQDWIQVKLTILSCILPNAYILSIWVSQNIKLSRTLLSQTFWYIKVLNLWFKISQAWCKQCFVNSDLGLANLKTNCLSDFYHMHYSLTIMIRFDWTI